MVAVSYKWFYIEGFKHTTKMCRDAEGKLSEATAKHPSHNKANHPTLEPVGTKPVPH